MSPRGMALLGGALLFTLASGFGMGWHVQEARVDREHRAAVAWADSTQRVHDEQQQALAKAAIAAKVAAADAQRRTDSAFAMAEQHRHHETGLRQTIDSLKQFPVHDTVLVATQDSLIATLTAETTNLRASLSAAIRASAQYQLALAASDSALVLARLRVAALDSALRAVPPVSPATKCLLCFPKIPRVVGFAAGVLVGMVVKR